MLRYKTIVTAILLTTYIRCSQHRTKRMVLGNKVEISEWPFVAWLVKDKTAGYPRYCGGSLIKDEWVITAAHCVDTVVNKPWALSVRIGSVKRVFMKHQSKFHYNVSKIYLYSGYISNVIPNDDIALLKLSRPVAINQYTFIRPIRIALWKIPDDSRDDFQCRAAGWGKHKVFDSLMALKDAEAKPSKYLKEITVPLLSKQTCIEKFELKDHSSLIENKTVFWEKMICGGSDNARIGTACLHDSGSPLICKDKYDNIDLHGITIAIHGPEVRTKPCAPGKQIMVFMRLSYYAKWILDIVNTNN